NSWIAAPPIPSPVSYRPLLLESTKAKPWRKAPCERRHRSSSDSTPSADFRQLLLRRREARASVRFFFFRKPPFTNQPIFISILPSLFRNAMESTLKARSTFGALANPIERCLLRMQDLAFGRAAN